MNDRKPDLLVTGPFGVTVSDRGAWAKPNQTLVFTHDDGSATELQRRPSAFGSFRYRYRYGVDTSDHVTRWTESLTSGTGGYSFQAALEARWKVTGATEVVRRDIRTVADGGSTVQVAIRDLLWPYAGQYGIERIDDFAHIVRSVLCGRSHQLPEGLTVVTLTARIHLDDHAAAHLRQLKQEQFNRQLAVEKNKTDMLAHQLDTDLQQAKDAAMRAVVTGDGGLMIRLLSQDPSRLHEIMLEMGQRHDIAVEQKSRLLKDLIDARLIQPADAQTMWAEMHRPASLFGGMPTALAPPTGGRPPAQLIPGVVVTPPDDAPPKPRRREPEAGAPGPFPPRPDHTVPTPTPRPPEPYPDPPAPVTRPPEPYPYPYPDPDSDPLAPAPAPSGPDPAPTVVDDDGGGSANVVGSTPVGRRRPRTDGDDTSGAPT
ncbi:hypothetical protein ACIPSA_11385 [Streptomyces sp. NPDC086549]|uniref:hypothetical protein n=1 Tax=Streptomyces sp. NPDC086549 TaxID=3365752 RepID=UPI00381112E4